MTINKSIRLYTDTEIASKHKRVMYFEVSNNGFYFPRVKLQRVQLVDGEALVCLLGVPEMVAGVPVGVGAEAPRHRGHPQGAGAWSMVPCLTPLYRSVDRHRPAGKVLQLLDAGLSPEVGWCGQGSAEARGRGHPGVREKLLCGQPLGAVFGQQLQDEGPGHHGDLRPVSLGEGHVALADVLEEALLTLGAVLSLVPAAVVAAVAREGGVATEKDVHDDSQGPHITFLVVDDRVLVLVRVVFIITDEEGVDHLGGHVLEAAHRGQEVRGADVDVAGVAAEVKVTELDRDGGVCVDAEDVVRLDIPVGDAATVKELDGGGEICHHLACLGLREMDSGLNVIQQWTSRHFLKHKTESVVLLEILDELDDIRLASAQVVYLNLLQHLAPAVEAGAFLYNFHSVL